MKDGISLQGFDVAEKGFVGRLAAAQRQRLLRAFHEFSRPGGSVLEVGLAPTSKTPPLERFTTADMASGKDSVVLHRVGAGQPADGSSGKSESLILPFEDGQFDWACSNGLMEHMGSNAMQLDLLREMTRVARKGVFVATPNRGHPINFSAAARSRLLRAQDLYGLAASLPGKPEHDVGHKRVFGIKAHFFLMIAKNGIA